MWPLRTFAYFSTFWIACALSLFNPIWGVVNYLLIYQMNPIGTWWGRPIADMGVRYSLFAISFTVLGMFFARKRVPSIRPTFSAWEIGLLLLLAIAAFNLWFGVEYGERSHLTFEILWKMFIFVLIIARLATTRDNFRIVIWSLVMGSLYLGWDAFTAPGDAFVSGRLEHVGGSDFSTTSGFAAHLGAMLPIVGVAFLTAQKWRWRMVAAIAGALMVNAIIMCRTRSAFIGLIIGGLTAFLLAPRARRFRIHGLLIAAAAMAFTLTDSPFWTRMATLSSPDSLTADPAANTRLAIWRASLSVLVDHPFGVGVGNFTRVIGNYDPVLNKRASHNTLLLAFIELGIHGGIIFSGMIFGSLWFAFRSSILADRCQCPLETKLTAYGLLVACVTYFITGLGTERFLCESYWWVMVLPLCLYRVVLREVNETARIAEREGQSENTENVVESGNLQGAW